MAEVPPEVGEALGMVESGIGFLADLDPAELPGAALAEILRRLEQIDAVAAVARGRVLAAFDARDVHLGDGQRTTMAWLVHCLGLTKGQAAAHMAVAGVARDHRPLAAGLRQGQLLTASVAVLLAKWLRKLPAEFREEAGRLLAGAALAGAGLQGLAAMFAEILEATAGPDPDGPAPADRGLNLHTTMDGAGVLRGDLTPECAALVRAVLDALSAPGPGGDRRTRAQRSHDALAEAMKRLLASGLLPQRAGQPVKALAHIHFTELLALDGSSALQDTWITACRARWAARRAAAAAGPSDGGAWLEGEAARAVACDAMIVPVVTADIDPAAIEGLIALCVEYDRTRGRHAAAADQESASTGPDGAAGDAQAAVAARGGGGSRALEMLEHQILAQVIQVVSGPGGIASFLRRHLLGKPLAGPSLPLDVGQTDEIPLHLRRLVALRDQHCQFPGGCDQPACACEPHHVIHRADGGRTSLAGLKAYCHWHHHVVLHQMGWTLTVHPDGTSEVTSPDGTKVIRSHGPPPRPG